MAYVLAPPTVFGTDFSRCRPVVFDPYLSNRRLLRDILTDLGCDTVMDCGRSRDAIATIESEQPNILFLDWSEQVDAVAFLHHLRAPANPHRFVPVVVMTAYSGLTHIAAARDAGANEFMLRPWSQQVVASRLRSIVEHPRLFIQGGGFFGPDRRRRRLDFLDPERRRHENWRSADRRDPTGAVWDGVERRQGRFGFEPLERRDAPRA